MNLPSPRSLQAPILLLALSALLGCPGPSSSSPAAPSGPTAGVTAVQVTPNPVTLGPGQSQAFGASVTGTGSFNAWVTWSTNGGSIGNATNQQCVWTAPATPGSFWVKAVSVADPSKSDTAIITVSQATGVAISSFTVSPSSVTAGQPVTLTAVFSNATSASVDHGVGAVVSGVSYFDLPGTTTTYTLTANGIGGPVTRTATVTVGGPASLSVGGSVVDAPVAGATVRFYALTSTGGTGSLLGTTTTDASGNFGLVLTPAPTTPFLVQATGGAYVDEVKGISVPLLAGDSLEAVLPPGTAQCAITPLTTMAAARARALARGGAPLGLAVLSSNIGVASQFNLPDILAAAPKSARDPLAMQVTNREDRNYSLVLAGISQYASSRGIRAIDLSKSLALDLEDGILDGKNGGTVIPIPDPGGSLEGPETRRVAMLLADPPPVPALQAAINDFANSPLNRTNLGTFPIASGPIQVGMANASILWSPTPALPNWTSGQSGSVTLGAVGGTPFAAPPAYRWQLLSGAPPNGLVFAPDGTLSGRAPTLGSGQTRLISAPFIVRVTDAAGAHVDLELRVTIVAEKPQVITYQNQKMTVGVAGAVLVAASERCGTGPCHFAIDSLAYGSPPMGTGVDLNGFLTGTPSQAGTYSFRVCIIDLVGAEDCGLSSVIVEAPNRFQGNLAGNWAGNVNLAPGGTQAQAIPVNGTFSITISATGAVTGSYSGSSSGTISGQVDNSGNYTAGSGGGSGGIAWTGTFQKNGSQLTATGTWSGSGGGGSWSGSGSASN